jgi:hypothetical protein
MSKNVPRHRHIVAIFVMMILCASVATVNHALPSMSLAADMLQPIKHTNS